MNYILVPDLRDLQVAEGGILSKTIQNSDRSKVIQFCFAPGQELSAHTAPFPASIYIAKGQATLKLGAEQVDASEGTFAYMEANLEHGIVAKTEVVMLLTMFKNPLK